MGKNLLWNPFYTAAWLLSKSKVNELEFKGNPGCKYCHHGIKIFPPEVNQGCHHI